MQSTLPKTGPDQIIPRLTDEAPPPEEAIRKILQHPREFGFLECSLCGSSPFRNTGLFLPSPAFARRIGEPKGKRRVIVYALCANCADDFDAAGRAWRR